LIFYVKLLLNNLKYF